jgi:hypothetical protein
MSASVQIFLAEIYQMKTSSLKTVFTILPLHRSRKRPRVSATLPAPAERSRKRAHAGETSGPPTISTARSQKRDAEARLCRRKDGERVPASPQPASGGGARHGCLAGTARTDSASPGTATPRAPEAPTHWWTPLLRFGESWRGAADGTAQPSCRWRNTP